MDFLTFVLLLAAGMVCGVVNVVGGGGSLLALPVLLALGLPAPVANGTNRLAILFQDIAALTSFRKKGQFDWREGWPYSLPVVAGALVGAWLAALYLTEMVMNIAILVLIVGMIAALFFQPGKWTGAAGEKRAGRPRFTDKVLFFLIGVYGGFIQAGFTYLVLAVFVLKTGIGMVRADALKLFLNLLILPVALVIFFWHHQIDWLYGLVLGVGSALGGYGGVRFVTVWSPRLIRSLLLVLLLLSALYIIFVRL